MRVGVNGREMADENIPLVLDVLQRMVRQGMEPQLTSGLAEWLIRKGATVEFPVLTPELLSAQDLDLFMREMENGDVALALLNRGRAGAGSQTIDLAQLGYAPATQVSVRDVWAAETLSPVRGSFATRPLASHETILLRVSLVTKPAPRGGEL